MALFFLGLGILVPWYTGFIWLQIIAQVRASARPAPHELLLRAGYGYFIGCSLVQGLVHLSSAVQGNISFAAIVGTLLILSLTGTVLAALQYRIKAPAPTPVSLPASTRYRVICIGLLGLTALHLIPLLLENQYRPIYPWDAWQTWMYRAKAWFLSGQLLPMAPPNEWLQTGVINYNMPGHSYPTLASVIALWAAISMGSWSETLVNLPVFCAALATLAGLYGQIKSSGFRELGALAGIYLLVSIPLWGTHVALAGQADIWMAGYVGLGFVALLRGISDHDRSSLWLGILMCALAMGVKNEGAVWFIGALALAFAGSFWRTALVGAACGSALALVLWRFHLHWSIPGLGVFGFDGKLLYLPVLGTIPIQQFAVWDDYIDAFFLQGSWNILWPLVAISAATLLKGSRDGCWRALLGFFVLLFATQALIFGFTQHGRWAEDGTAINRLPLHFAPALVYALLLSVRRLTKGEALQPKIDARTTLITAAGASLLCGAAFLTYLAWDHPATDGTALDLTSRIRTPVGSTTSDDGGLTVTSYQGGIAILSSGPIAVDSAELTTLSVTTTGTSISPAGFFWRTAGNRENVNTANIGYAGPHTIDLSREPEWTGTITEVGLVLHDDQQDGSAGLRRLVLKPSSLENSLKLVWSEWTELELWSQKSAHWLSGGAREQRLPLTVLAGIWLLVALLLCIIPRPNQRMTQALALIIVTWTLVDVRWLTTSTRQTARTVDYYTHSDRPEALDIDFDVQLGEIAEAAKSMLQPDTDQPLILTGAERNLHFKVMRGKYWMLPHPTAVFEQPVAELSSGPDNQVLYIDAFKLEPGEVRKASSHIISTMGPSFHSGWQAQAVAGGEAIIVNYRGDQ
ncbi:hypothetical protein [Parahaliea aestuarii]|uniref:Uncharacterized protein n=1 Tax=Parahaliea aestuarii TaxID=1852021 RepID=A0A5C8ZPD3_9GAMM|nr:hypothetical protein [Parahaliea aestuarii]TXS89427.1 hypothetical protein FVW59_18095 [Parahaliea aestuarii]